MVAHAMAVTVATAEKGLAGGGSNLVNYAVVCTDSHIIQ